MMHLRIDLGWDFGGFWEGKWKQVGTKINEKSMSTSKGDFLKNRALAAAGARFLRFWGSKLGIKIDQKSMPIAKCDFLKNRALAAAWARFL